MSIPTRETIDTFMSITGAAESVALQKLEEYGGNLNAAVSAHFLEMERHITNQSVIPVSHQRNPLNPNYQSRDATPGILPLLSSIRSFRPSLLLDPNYRRSLINQIGSSSFKNNTMHSPAQEGLMSSSQHDQVNVPPYYPEPRHTPNSGSTQWYYGDEIHGTVTGDNNLQLDNGIESEMIQAAIEASMQEARSSYTTRQSDLFNAENHQEDEEVARAISLSLKTAEEEDAICALRAEKEFKRLRIRDSSREQGTKRGSSWQAESSSPRQQPVSHILQHSKDTVSAEWAGFSSKELDESIMLEKQFFGHNHGGVRYQTVPDRSRTNSVQPESHPQSSMGQEQREKQDTKCPAPVLVSRPKEKNATKEAENGHFTEELQREKPERQKTLNTEETSLLPEPAIYNDNAVNLVVRMPDGTRHSRRFLKSDKLRFLFNFIDVGKGVKPGTYCLVRPYPRQAFGLADSHSSLLELGLTGKQEALFLVFM